MGGRTEIILLSALVAHTARHRMVDRGEILWTAPWPKVTASSFYSLAPWIFAVLLAAAAAKLLASCLARRWPRKRLTSLEAAQPLGAIKTIT
jgi:hypothetical protein